MPRSKQALLSPRAASRNRLSTRNCAVFRLLAMIKPPRITPCSAIWRDGFNKWLTRLTLFGQVDRNVVDQPRAADPGGGEHRSEEHTSELQSLMRISYAVICLQKTKMCTTSDLNLLLHNAHTTHTLY